MKNFYIFFINSSFKADVKIEIVNKYTAKRIKFMKWIVIKNNNKWKNRIFPGKRIFRIYHEPDPVSGGPRGPKNVENSNGLIRPGFL